MLNLILLFALTLIIAMVLLGVRALRQIADVQVGIDKERGRL